MLNHQFSKVNILKEDSNQAMLPKYYNAAGPRKFSTVDMHGGDDSAKRIWHITFVLFAF